MSSKKILAITLIFASLMIVSSMLVEGGSVQAFEVSVDGSVQEVEDNRSFLEVLQDEIKHTMGSFGDFFRSFPDLVSNVLGGWGSSLNVWYGIFIFIAAIIVFIFAITVTGGIQKWMDAIKERIS